MHIYPIHTRAFIPPKDDIYSLIKDHCIPLQSEDIIVLSSKVVAIHQGRTIEKDKVHNIVTLQNKEADHIILSQKQNKYNSPLLSIKYNTFTPMSGIDESNANGYYILLPKEPHTEARNIQKILREMYSLDKLGVIISDSFLIPMRYGSIGISIGFYGFHPLQDYRNTHDIFGRELKMSQLNIVDSLSTIANYYMGEGNEQIPIVILRDIKRVIFSNNAITKDDLYIQKEQDIYYPLLEPYIKNTIQ